MSIRGVARQLGRSPSTVSRELRRQPNRQQAYDAEAAVKNARANRYRCRPQRKLVKGGELYTIVLDMLRQRWSPQQISGTLARMFPDHPNYQVSHETLYKTLYAIPCGELRKELIICSAVGSLVERVSGLVFFAKVDGATATAAVEGFSAALNRVPLKMRKTFTYDQGRELVRHAEITQKTGTAIYFADPHSPWQRAINENTNGLLRQYMPKGTDLSVFSQEELDAIAFQLNSRPRKRLDFQTPPEVFMEMIKNKQPASSSVH